MMLVTGGASQRKAYRSLRTEFDPFGAVETKNPFQNRLQVLSMIRPCGKTNMTEISVSGPPSLR